MLGMKQKQAISFLTACEEGTIRGASERLRVEPSSVSRHITALEKRLSVTLIERGRRGVLPTEAGHILLEYLKHQKSDFEAVLSAFDELRGMQRGELRVAIGDGFVGDFIGNALADFVRALPGLTYSFQTGSTEQILHAIKTDQAHLGIAFNAGQDRSIRIISQAKQPLMMLANPASNFAQSSEKVSLQSLIEMPSALLQPSFGVGALIKDVETLYKVRFRPIIVADSFTLVRNFVHEGLGITVLPAFAVAREMDDGTIIAKSLAVPEFNHGDVSLIARQGRRLPESAIRLANHAVRSMMAFRSHS